MNSTRIDHLKSAVARLEKLALHARGRNDALAAATLTQRMNEISRAIANEAGRGDAS